MVLIQRTFRIRSILKEKNCAGILICSGDFIDFLAGYLASRLCRVPFYVYLFDPCLGQQPNRLYQQFSRRIKARVLRKASVVVVSNEFLQEELERCYGISCRLIRHACDKSLSREKEIAWPFEENKISIIYTGAIHRVQYDAFRNLVKAIRQWRQPELELHVYASREEKGPQKETLGGPVAYHFHFSPTQIREIQRRADILYLPLAFDVANPEDMKTSAPVKMGEYLHTGRPILVHAPSDSFVAWYFKKYQCGAVVDQNDPEILRDAIRWIIEDKSLREQLKENALSRAGTDFDLEVARSLFIKVFQKDRERVSP
jgi:glycosyltransferase involved in cell wall biosynthesis